MRRAILLAALCTLWSGALTAIADEKDDAASGWLGTWQALGQTDCKELRCAAQRVEGEKWQATFTGVCSREFSFQVKMNGIRKADKIVFEGTTDLGEQNGGVYRWSGEIIGQKFTGKYKSDGGKEGTFEMKPASAEPKE
jgi:hypothetical protein